MQRLPDLTGKTVLVVGGGSRVNLNPKCDFTIAASSGIKSAPNADMLVMIDGVMPPHGVGYDLAHVGIFVVGVPTDIPGRIYIPFPYEHVAIRTGKTVHMRNNGISAIRIAADRGAACILLDGFDPAAYDQFNSEFGYDGVVASAIPALIRELSERGIKVEFVKKSTRIARKSKARQG